MAIKKRIAAIRPFFGIVPKMGRSSAYLVLGLSTLEISEKYLFTF